MKQKTRGVGVGTVSLIMIFAVLCLTVFAMLTLSTANAEKALAQRTASFVSGYYEADTKATQIRAQILESFRSGVLIEYVEGVEIKFEQSDNGIIASYITKLNEVLDLSVRLRLLGNEDTVLEWRTVHSGEWEIDDSILVWDGVFPD